MKRLLLLPIFASITACSFNRELPVQAHGPKLREVVREIERMPVTLPGAEQRSEVPERESVEQVLDRYRSLVTRVRDPQVAAALRRRAAELEMRRVSEQIAQGEVVDVVPVVDELAAAVADHDDPALRYRLAQMLELQGKRDAVVEQLGALVDSSAAPERRFEAQFRRAELRFSRGEYGPAAVDYLAVSKSDTAFSLHATYMYGWSAIKSGDYAAGLDAMLATTARLESAEATGAQAELAEDATRAMILALDYLEGAATLAAAMKLRDRPVWQIDTYRALGRWYREKERFTDSAKTWQVFLDENPLDPGAPLIVLEVIDTHRQAGFVEEIPAWELRYVESFDASSEFHSVHGALAGPERQRLREFTDRIVASRHAAAQETGAAEDFAVAAGWYRRWLDNFAELPEAAEMTFLMAEALIGAEADRESIDAFQRVVDTHIETDFAREAAWAIVTGLRDLGDGAMTDEQVAAALQFAELFPEDPRGPGALAAASSLLFEDGAFERAAIMAERALGSLVDADQKIAAMRVAAHSRFELGEYPVSTRWYQLLLERQPDSRALRERLLASVFSEGQQLEQSGDLIAAIERYDSLVAIDPASSLAIDARYDVAQLREQSGNPLAAAADLEAFRRNYPEHPAVADIPLRLVALYEAGEALSAAAVELVSIHDRGSAAPALRRQSLYRAGELWLAAGNTGEAISTFRRYAHGYETPVPLRLEAMQHMDELYAQTGEDDKRRFWLRKKVATFNELAESERFSRGRFLAADAALQLAQFERRAFDAIPLDQPLQRSLKNKQQAMKSALTRFSQAAGFGVAETRSAATYAMADMYSSLAAALINSARPGGLNELELSQYELLLEEQAFPFEEKAIDLHETNLRLGWESGFDESISLSLDALRTMVPGRFDRPVMEVAHANTLY